jgi:hypothetical protein
MAQESDPSACPQCEGHEARQDVIVALSCTSVILLITTILFAVFWRKSVKITHLPLYQALYGAENEEDDISTPMNMADGNGLSTPYKEFHDGHVDSFAASRQY